MDAGSALSVYFSATEHKKRMEAETESAHRGLEIAGIRERAAEVRSQHEPLAALIDKIGLAKDNTPLPISNAAREVIVSLVEYVVYGRSLESK